VAKLHRSLDGDKKGLEDILGERAARDETVMPLNWVSDCPASSDDPGSTVGVHDHVDDDVGQPCLPSLPPGRVVLDAFVAFGAIQERDKTGLSFPSQYFHVSSSAKGERPGSDMPPIVKGTAPINHISLPNDHPDSVNVAEEPNGS
jgi:hypothetical protein